MAGHGGQRGLDARLYPPRAPRTAAQPTADALPDTTPCAGCHTPRHPTVGKTPCTTCGTVRWTLAITGSRSLATAPDLVLTAARAGTAELRDRMGGWPALLLHGDAAGVDRLLAAAMGAAGWPVEALPADWDRHGRRAGILRDLVLVGRADALLAVWDGASPGTRATLQFAADRHLPLAGAIVRDGRTQPLPQLPGRARPATPAPPLTPSREPALERAEGLLL